MSISSVAGAQLAASAGDTRETRGLERSNQPLSTAPVAVLEPRDSSGEQPTTDGHGHRGSPLNSSEPESAPPFDLVLHYQVPAECPGVSVLLAHLGKHLEAGDDSLLPTWIDIVRVADAYRLTVKTEVATVSRQSQHWASACEPLVAVAAFMAAAARTEPPALIDQLRWAVQRQGTGPGSQPEAEVLAVADRVVAPQARLDASGAAGQNRLRAARDQESSIAERGLDEPSDGPSWLFGAQARAGSGFLPRQSFGFGPHLGLMQEGWSLYATLSAWLSQPAPRPFDSLEPVQVALQSLDLGGCAEQPLRIIEAWGIALEGCAQLSLNRFSASVQQPRPASDQAYRGGVGAALGAVWRGPLGWVLEGQLGSDWLWNTFSVNQAPFITGYESTLRQTRFQLIVGWNLDPREDRVANGPSTRWKRGTSRQGDLARVQ